MTGIERLVDIVNDGPYSGGMIHISVQKLREICEQIEGEVDDISGRDSDVLAWVEEHGGLDAVNERTMPEDMSWPRYESGELVQIGDDVVGTDYGEHIRVDAVKFHANGFVLCDKDGFSKWYESDDRFKRPAPKILDADGVEIRVGDTVYYVDGREQRVNTVARLTDNGCVQFGRINEAGYVTYCEAACIQPNLLTHRAPVLAADGLPPREGETVYVCVDYPYSADIVKGEAVSVRSAYGSNDAEVVDRKGDVWFVDADQLTHKPFDSWERLEDDATRPPRDYCGMLLHWAIIPEQNDGHYIEGMASDLVRRAKALAGVSE